MTEPFATIDWRHEGYRQLRAHVDETGVGYGAHDLALALARIAETTDSVTSLTTALEDFASERGLSVDVNSNVDHANTLGNWVTITLQSLR